VLSKRLKEYLENARRIQSARKSIKSFSAASAKDVARILL